jgi:hypothetical protein
VCSFRPYADACAGLVVCASASRRTFRRGVLDGRPHGSQRGCAGASPTQSCLRGQASVRTRRLRASGRPAVRGRGRDAGGDAGLRALAVERGKRDLSYRQPTGRSGHGTNGFPHRRTGLHRRTPHGRAFACGTRFPWHLDSDHAAERIESFPQRRSADTTCDRSRMASQIDGESLRFHERAANFFPTTTGRSTFRAGRVATPADLPKCLKNRRPRGGPAIRSWKR